MENTGLSTFLTSITGALADFSVSNLGTVLVAALGLTVGLSLAWFGYRWVSGKVAKALRKGRI